MATWRSGSPRRGARTCWGFGSSKPKRAKFLAAGDDGDQRSRGVNDILVAIVDGLKGFPEAINAVFAETQIQTCIVHLIRNSLDFCSWKDRKPVAQEPQDRLSCRRCPSRRRGAAGI